MVSVHVLQRALRLKEFINPKIAIDTFVKSKFELRFLNIGRLRARGMLFGCYFRNTLAEHHCHCRGKSGVHQTT